MPESAAPFAIVIALADTLAAATPTTATAQAVGNP
jgi:hypothetical protein